MSWRRWDVYWADLEPVRGHEQGELRPVLILSRDEHNTPKHEMVTVVSLSRLDTKSRRDKPWPWEVELPEGMIEAGKVTVVLPRQLRSISTDRLKGKLASLSDEAQQRRIEDAVLDHLGMEYDEVQE